MNEIIKMNTTIKVTSETKLKFDKLQSDLKFKEKKSKTQDELVDLLINVFKENYKKKGVEKKEWI